MRRDPQPLQSMQVRRPAPLEGDCDYCTTEPHRNTALPSEGLRRWKAIATYSDEGSLPSCLHRPKACAAGRRWRHTPHAGDLLAEIDKARGPTHREGSCDPTGMRATDGV